ncbi:MAG: hypothetical protein ACW98D_20345 [Promethearchaeota archaeon]|jgi:hypothetical protein
MKGQFFIISTVIIVSALMVIVQHLYDFGKVDLTNVEEMRELDYIGIVKDTLRNTIIDSTRVWGDCSKLNKDLNYSIYFMKNKLKEKGINLEISYNIHSACGADFNFNISTSDYFSETNFNYP